VLPGRFGNGQYRARRLAISDNTVGDRIDGRGKRLGRQGPTSAVPDAPGTNLGTGCELLRFGIGSARTPSSNKIRLVVPSAVTRQADSGKSGPGDGAWKPTPGRTDVVNQKAGTQDGNPQARRRHMVAAPKRTILSLFLTAFWIPRCVSGRSLI